MNIKEQPSKADFLNSIFNELLETLLQPEASDLWLRKVVNLLKQFLNAESIILNAFGDNSIVISSDLEENKVIHKYSDVSEVDKPFWSSESYIVPLELEGYIEIVWSKKPLQSELNTYNTVFSFITVALKNRASLITQQLVFSKDEFLSKCEQILNMGLDLKSSLALFAKELALFLDASRCQIKLFSESCSSVFDSMLSVEFVTKGFLEGLSVIPTIESEWISKIKHNQVLILNNNKIFSDAVNDVEALLSIRSVSGYPLIYKNKALGVIVLHQCDRERIWKSEELQYLREVSLVLSSLCGKELEMKEIVESKRSHLGEFVINSDEFLKELAHLQISSQVKKTCFSLLMIDIEKLKEINLKMGFVGGNLVLSQTARFLKRHFQEKYKIARYSNDEFVVIMDEVDHSKAEVEAQELKHKFSDFVVLGVGPVEYNFSFVTYPTHSDSIQELLGFLEQAMLLSKSRGKFQISNVGEIKGQPKGRWEQLVSNAIPEIIFKKTNFKTGPEVIDAINEQIFTQQKTKAYSTDILDSVQSLAIALDAKDSYTEGHSNRVSEYAYILAKNISLDFQDVEWIRLAAAMHDIGKIGIPENILCKPGKLTKEEYDVMKKHPVIGAKILKPIKPLEKVANLVLYHHECWDGSGYPNGLLKEEIPIGSRIVSIVDAYQAMTSSRPYRSALPFEEAIKRLRAGKEKQWDSELVEMFIKIVS